MQTEPNKTEGPRDLKVSEQVFKYVDSKTVDNKYRVSLGKKVARFLKSMASPKSMDIYLSPDGDILLRPMARIPASEAWIWQDEEVRASFARALGEARSGKTTPIDDLDDFLENL